MFAARFARATLIAACAAVAGCAADPHASDAEAKTDAHKNAKYGEWLREHEVPGSHDGQWASYADMHRFFVDSFVRSEGFGMHRMTTPQDLARRSALSVDGKAYGIGGVELISLGRPTDDGTVSEPFVYAEGHRGRDYFALWDVMKSKLHETKTREPHPFETAALAKLRDGEESVVGEDEGKPVLVGAVRATTSCLECHKVKEGTLLGALTYPLVAVGADRRY